MTKDLRKRYKPLNLIVITDGNTGLEILVAEMTKVLPVFAANDRDILGTHFSVSNGEIFIFVYNSEIANKIIENPEIEVSLDINDFAVMPAKFDNFKNTEAYFHRATFDKIYSRPTENSHNSVKLNIGEHPFLKEIVSKLAKKLIEKEDKEYEDLILETQSYYDDFILEQVKYHVCTKVEAIALSEKFYKLINGMLEAGKYTKEVEGKLSAFLSPVGMKKLIKKTNDNYHMMVNGFLIVAEIIQHNLRCGFIIGCTSSEDIAEQVIETHYKAHLKDRQKHFNILYRECRSYPIGGDDYISGRRSITDGVFSIIVVKIENCNNIEKFIMERQIKTNSFQLGDNTRLADHYLFDGEISGCN